MIKINFTSLSQREKQTKELNSEQFSLRDRQQQKKLIKNQQRQNQQLFTDQKPKSLKPNKQKQFSDESIPSRQKQLNPGNFTFNTNYSFQRTQEKVKERQRQVSSGKQEHVAPQVKVQMIQIGTKQVTHKQEIQVMNSQLLGIQMEKEALVKKLTVWEGENTRLCLKIATMEDEIQQLNEKIQQIEDSIIYKTSKDIAKKFLSLENLNFNLITELGEIKKQVLKQTVKKDMQPVRQMKKIQLLERMTKKLNHKITKHGQWKQNLEQHYKKIQKQNKVITQREKQYHHIIQTERHKIDNYQRVLTGWENEMEVMIKNYQHDFQSLRKNERRQQNFQSLIRQNISLRQEVNILKREVYLKKESKNYQFKTQSAYEKRNEYESINEEEETIVNQIAQYHEGFEEKLQKKIDILQNNLQKELSSNNSRQQRYNNRSEYHLAPTISRLSSCDRNYKSEFNRLK